MTPSTLVPPVPEAFLPSISPRKRRAGSSRRGPSSMASSKLPPALQSAPMAISTSPSDSSSACGASPRRGRRGGRSSTGSRTCRNSWCTSQTGPEIRRRHGELKNRAPRSVQGRDWSGKRRIQSLEVLLHEHRRKRHSVFLDVRRRTGLGNCDNGSAANHPGERDRGGGATIGGADLRQLAVAHHEVIVAAEGRVRHDRQLVLLTPR